MRNEMNTFIHFSRTKGVGVLQINNRFEHCWLSSYQASDFYANHSDQAFYAGLDKFLQVRWIIHSFC
jgi:nucleoside diphosphate kinase